jgi:lysophospholipase L1-like esterase
MDVGMLSVDRLGPHRRPWLLPLLFLQGSWLRRRIPELPAPDDATAGEVPGRGLPLRVLVFGDSAAVAVGVRSQSQGLAACLASALAQRSGRPVHWRAHGRSGMTALDAAPELASLLAAARADPHYDLIATSLGGNDAVKLSPSQPFVAAMRSVLASLRDLLAPGGLVVVGRAPPFACSPHFRPPLRDLVAWRCARINALLAELSAEHPQQRFADAPIELAATDFAEDGFHPNAESYRAWAMHLAERFLSDDARSEREVAEQAREQA